MIFQVDQRVGDYEILQMVGAGGMGHVYRVRNIISNRIEAMKVLLPDLAAERDLAVRFIVEIRTLASFDHPNIALLHTAFQTDNQLVMMMEFVEGSTLEHRSQESAMAPGEVVQIISQALSALSYAHARGVVHRDVKPANIMVTQRGVAKLMDFGIAKSRLDKTLTVPGTTIGSVYYMSPEQVQGGTIDARSDLYSIGIVLYELLAGVRPFDGDTSFGILNQHLNVQPRPPIEVNPSLAPDLSEIILKAIAKDPAERFQSADDFRSALDRYVVRVANTTTDDLAASSVAAPLTSAASFGPPPVAPQPGTAQPPTSTTYSAQPFPAAATVDPGPQYQPVPTPQSSVPVPLAQQSKHGHRMLWIGTGAAAALLALVAVAFMVPRYKHAHADEPAQSPPVYASPGAVIAAPTPAVNAEPTAPLTNEASPAIAVPTVAASSAGADLAPKSGVSRSPQRRGFSSPPPTPARQPAQNPGPVSVVAAGGMASAAGNEPPPPPHNAEFTQMRENLIQLNARANAARSGLQQIRSRQEQMGLGLRGDQEASESRLNSYLSAASDDLRSGDTASASRDMEKADAELGSLEKFLGR